MANSVENSPKKGFLVWNMISQGWQIMKKQVWQLLGLQVVLVLLLCVILGVVELLLPDNVDAAWYFWLSNKCISLIVNECFALGILTLSLQFADGVPVKFTDFFSKMHLVLIYLLSSILAGICIMLGFICFIVPGIIIALRFSMFGYLIIDKNMGPIEALKESWHLVKGVTGRMLGFWLAGTLIMLAGLLCFGVGLLFAFPTVSIATGLLYRLLWNQTKMAALEAKS